MLGAVAPRAPAMSGKGRIVAFMMSILAEMRPFIRQASLDTPRFARLLEARGALGVA